MSDNISKQAFTNINQASQAASTGMKSAVDSSMNVMQEFTRMFSDMRLPAMPDVEGLLAAHRRNMETLSAANRVALEGAQIVARRNMEIMQQSISELSDTVRQLTTAESPQARALKQTELLKGAYERAVTNMKELADLIQRSNSEAVELLNNRFTEAMDEVKTIMSKAGQGAGQGSGQGASS